MRQRPAKAPYCAEPKSARWPRHPLGKHRWRQLRGQPSTFLRQECGACKRWAMQENRGADSPHRPAANARCSAPLPPAGSGLHPLATPRESGLGARKSEGGVHPPGSWPLWDLFREPPHYFASYFPRSSTFVNGGRQHRTRAAGWLGKTTTPQTSKALESRPEIRTRYPRAGDFSISGSNGSA